MTPKAMGEFIVRAADAFGLMQPHLVGPEVGTGASLFAAALYPDRFRSLINGARDPVVPSVNAEYLHERLTNSKLNIIDAGHFIWEDAADAYSELVTSWWAGGYAKAGELPEVTGPHSEYPGRVLTADKLIYDNREGISHEAQ